MYIVQWSPSIMDTTGTFVLYSEESFAQGLFKVDHAPLTIVASYAGERQWTMKSVLLMIDLLKNQGHIWAILQL